MLYGRRIGRRLTDNQKDRLDKFLSDFEIRWEGDHFFLPEEWKAYSDTQMEIGFGTADHLVLQAEHHPTTLFLGCEPFLNGVAALALKVDEKKLKNIRVFKDDAAILLRALPDAFLSKIFLLFPDPWPKKRHHKRRFVSSENLDLLASKLGPKGSLLIATDHTDYGAWIKDHLTRHPAFHIITETETAPALWHTTRFQEKAHTKGQKATFFLVEKIIS